MKLRPLLNIISVLLFSFSIAITFNPFSAEASTIINPAPKSGELKSDVIPPTSGSIEISAKTDNIPDNAPGVLPFINNSGKTIVFSISGQKIKVVGDTARWDYGPPCQSGLTGDAAKICVPPSGYKLKCDALAGGALFSELKSSAGTTTCALVGYNPISIIIPNGGSLRIFNNDYLGIYYDNSGTAVLNYSWDFQK
ncbi:MAG: hypothetical protein ACFKPT_24410 [Gloeotrichia echinulata GP01]